MILSLNAMQIIEADFSSHFNSYAMLLGRDVLSLGSFFYNGAANQYVLMF